ncbi:stefin-2-like, partial [Arvicanthis niloticus]|uniref:stefin-2-like n=1 Tax=Arvicanthis niloticus TaxID=61156 RepID=UPI00402B460F
NVKLLLEGKTNEKYEKFEAVQYKVLLGLNYFIKVFINSSSESMKALLASGQCGSSCSYASNNACTQGISGEDDLELSGYQTNKTKNEELSYF